MAHPLVLMYTIINGHTEPAKHDCDEAEGCQLMLGRHLLAYVPACARAADEVEIMAGKKHPRRWVSFVAVIILIFFWKLGHMLGILLWPEAMEQSLARWGCLCLLLFLVIYQLHQTLEYK